MVSKNAYKVTSAPANKKEPTPKQPKQPMQSISARGGSQSVYRAQFKEKIMNQIPHGQSRSVSQTPREMGGIKTQAKIESYFATQSARRQTKPQEYS